MVKVLSMLIHNAGIHLTIIALSHCITYTMPISADGKCVSEGYRFGVPLSKALARWDSSVMNMTIYLHAYTAVQFSDWCLPC